VDPPLPARRPLEVLHDVRDVGERAVDAGLVERGVEQPPRRPDERPALEVLLVPGLLADEHRPGSRLALAEDRLRARAPERAGAAAGGRVAQARKRRIVRNERGSGLRRARHHVCMTARQPQQTVQLRATRAEKG
jgi:hypothetical protein